MDFRKSFKNTLLQNTEYSFEALALELFYFQAINNPIYQKFLEYLRIKPQNIHSLAQIPFLPIDFFKHHTIVSGDFVPQKIFESSGTTLQQTSKHHIADLEFYQQISEKIFQEMYGNLTQYHILALLPSYLERDNSSLVYMVRHFIEQSQSDFSGFYLNNWEELNEKLQFLQQDTTRQTILLGVTFALLDLAEQFPQDLSSLIVMETGGMKGRRKEIIRAEMHYILKKYLNLSKVHSEYGMTELLSQAYSKGDEIFQMPSTMSILLRDTEDPLSISHTSSGGINVIDLANVDSCAFIATQDIGTLHSEGLFGVLGRFDNSDIRGCNLLLL